MIRILITENQLYIKNEYGDISFHHINSDEVKSIIENNEIVIYDGYKQLINLFKAHPELNPKIKQDIYLAGLMQQKPMKHLEELDRERYFNYPMEKLNINIKKVHEEIEIPFLIKMAKSFSKPNMFLNRTCYNKQKVKNSQEILEAKMDFYQKYNIELNPNSNKCLSIVFHDMKLESPIKTPKGSPSYNAEAFDKLLASDLTEEQRDCLLKIRDIKSKVQYQSVLDNLPTHVSNFDNYELVPLVPYVSQIGEDGTSRVYTTGPSLNQFPNQLRGCVVPPKGMKFVHIDWSCAELQILATLSQDEHLLNDLASNDFHKMTASRLFNTPTEQVSKEQREKAKIVNYSINYGITPKTLAFRMGITEIEATTIINNYNSVYNKAFQYKLSIQSLSREQRRTFTSFLRSRKLDYDTDPEGSSRQAINTHIQGTCADLFKIVFKRFNDSKIQPIFGVFDSFQFVADENLTDDEIKNLIDKHISEFKLYNIIDKNTYELKFKYSYGVSSNNWLEAIENSK